MGFISKLLGRDRADMRDAERIYRAVMVQSRLPEYFGEGKFADNYDGRIDFLTLNLSIIMKRLRDFGENGQILSQALFDVLKDDFEIAMREEGLSDKGIAKRIKPMIALFYGRLKLYDGAMDAGADELKTIFTKNLYLKSSDDEESLVDNNFVTTMVDYALEMQKTLDSKTLGDIATMKFNFPS